jgi:DnaA family protein
VTAHGAQLTLSFPLSSRARFDSFVAGPNGEVVRRLEQLMQEDPFTGCFLHGAAGVGRTHLLQAVCHHHGAAGALGGAIYLPLSDPAVTPASLEGLDVLPLVALDDVDAWLGQADAELALLTLYQGLQVAGGRLLVSAGLPATRLSFCYADLASRFRGLPTYQVLALADADKARVLTRMAQDRGLQLSPTVLDFWLARSARNMASLVDELERLDHAAMAAQRPLTVPLLKRVLGL